MRWCIPFLSWFVFDVLKMVQSGTTTPVLEEPVVEILSDKTDIKHFALWVRDGYLAVLYAADCIRPFAVVMPLRFEVIMASVGVNMTTGTFERCKIPGVQDPSMMVHRYKNKIDLMKHNYEPVKDLGMYNKNWNCTDVMSWWKESAGTDLPPWCTLFSILRLWGNNENLYINTYRNRQTHIEHGKDMLIIKPQIEWNTKDISFSKLLDETIVGKKIPKLFLQKSKFGMVTSKDGSTTTKVDTTMTTKKASATQETEEASTEPTENPNTTEKDSIDSDEKKANEGREIDVEADPALASTWPRKTVSAKINVKSLELLVIGLFVEVTVFSVIIIAVAVTLIVIVVRLRRQNNDYKASTLASQTTGESTTASTIQCGFSHPTWSDDANVENWKQPPAEFGRCH